MPPGTSAAIGRFYAGLFATPLNDAPHDGMPAVTLGVGPCQSWRFVERDLPDHRTHSMHVSFYTTNYARIRASLVASGATDGGTREDLFFFDRITDPKTGRTVFTINNEVRSLYHPDFRRPLTNRWPMVADPFCDTLPVEQDIERALGAVPGR